jgi:hypothetical protein
MAKVKLFVVYLNQLNNILENSETNTFRRTEQNRLFTPSISTTAQWQLRHEESLFAVATENLQRFLISQIINSNKIDGFHYQSWHLAIATRLYQFCSSLDFNLSL